MKHISEVGGNINSLDKFLTDLGFELYLTVPEDTFKDEEKLDHSTYTCISGKYSGDVVDVWYNPQSGRVSHKEAASQFKESIPVIRLK
jgi:hypothetical protein